MFKWALSASNEDEIPLKSSGSNDIGWNYEKLLKKNSYNEVSAINVTKLSREKYTSLSNMLLG